MNQIDFDRVLQVLPPRPVNSHKGSFGRLLNISGSSRYRGAAVLSCLGVLRAGAGLCVLASVPDACNAAAAGLPEAIFCTLPACEKGFIDSQKAIPLLQEEIPRASAVLLGCGLGNSQHTVDLLQFVLENTNCKEAAIPVVVDADGLNALAKNLHLLKNTHAKIILTPHPGEMSRLCGVSTSDIAGDREGFAMRFAKEYRVTLALKGHGTIVADADGSLLLNPTGGPGLAKGGSGDVLAGIIAAFAAQGISPVDACACGVYLHGLAADKTAARLGQYAMLASEITLDLAEILAAHGR
jgi:NAD(P)H-hydrate epimerase